MFELRGHGCVVLHGEVAFLGFGRRDEADGLQKPAIVEPVHPLEGCELDGLEVTPRSASMDDLGFVEAIDRFGEGVDAPMSVKSWLRPHQLGLVCGKDTQRSLKRHRRFEAAYDFGFGLALRGASADVVECRLVAPHTDDHYPIEGGVGLPVASTVEAVPDGLAA